MEISQREADLKHMDKVQDRASKILIAAKVTKNILNIATFMVGAA